MNKQTRALKKGILRLSSQSAIFFRQRNKLNALASRLPLTSDPQTQRCLAALTTINTISVETPSISQQVLAYEKYVFFLSICTLLLLMGMGITKHNVGLFMGSTLGYIPVLVFFMMAHNKIQNLEETDTHLLEDTKFALQESLDHQMLFDILTLQNEQNPLRLRSEIRSDRFNFFWMKLGKNAEHKKLIEIMSKLQDFEINLASTTNITPFKIYRRLNVLLVLVLASLVPTLFATTASQNHKAGFALIPEILGMAGIKFWQYTLHLEKIPRTYMHDLNAIIEEAKDLAAELQIEIPSDNYEWHSFFGTPTERTQNGIPLLPLSTSKTESLKL